MLPLPSSHPSPSPPRPLQGYPTCLSSFLGTTRPRVSCRSLSRTRGPLLLFRSAPRKLPLRPSRTCLCSQSSSIQRLFRRLRPRRKGCVLFLYGCWLFHLSFFLIFLFYHSGLSFGWGYRVISRVVQKAFRYGANYSRVATATVVFHGYACVGSFF